MKTYTGGCHCGAVRYEVTADLGRTIICNCSLCAMRGLVLGFTPADQFTLLSGEDALIDYRFNKKTIAHVFCNTCGVHPFSRPRSHPDSFDVNLRCLDGGIAEFEILPFDGQHWEDHVESIR